MTFRSPNLILLLLLQVHLLQFVTGLGIPKRDGQYTMNQGSVSWDESCNDINPHNRPETKRVAVQRAWVGALELIDVTWKRFNTATWPTVKEVKLNSVAQMHINQHDPGYVQLFALDSSTAGTSKIKSILEAMASQLNSSPGTNGRDETTKLTISCHNSFVYDGEDFCGKDFAGTRSFPNEDSSTINFCPSFFEQTKFDELKNKSPDEIRARYHNGNYHGTDALTVMHEVTHLWWIGPTNYGFDEEYGLILCAQMAWNCGNVIADNNAVVMNADTYGWYGEYGYFVEKGVQDLWPPSHPKPVQLPIQNYKTDTES